LDLMYNAGRGARSSSLRRAGRGRLRVLGVVPSPTSSSLITSTSHLFVPSDDDNDDDDDGEEEEGEEDVMDCMSKIFPTRT
jgi:hypothetical protein